MKSIIKSLVMCLTNLVVLSSCSLFGSANSSGSNNSTSSNPSSNYKIENAQGYEFVNEDSQYTTIKKTVHNNIDSISFIDELTVTKGCTWILSRDLEGIDVIKTKRMSLNEGHNNAYITIFSPNNEYNNVYYVDIYRLSMCTYSFIDGTIVLSSNTIEENQSITAPDNLPSKTEGSFLGWYDENDNLITFPYTVTSSINIYAKWSYNKYTITFDTDGGSYISPITLEYGSKIDIQFEPTKDGYIFAGWDKEVPETMPAYNFTLKALWNEADVLNPELISIKDLTNKYSAYNPLEITLWTGFGRDITEGLDQIISSFEDQYPYITVNHVQKGGYDKLHSAVMNSLPSATWPNVVVGYPDHLADYISCDIQYVLDGYINSNEYGVDLSNYYSQYMRENQSLLYKEHDKTKPYTTSLPFSKSTEVMVYNKTFFEAFDLTVPETWDDAITVGKEMINIIKTKDGANHFGTMWEYKKDDEHTYTFDFTSVTEDTFRPLSYDSQSNFFITLCYQFGGKYTEMGSSLTEGFMKFKGDAKVLEALNFVKKMSDDKILGVPGTWDQTDYCSKPFVAMNSMMTISSSAGVANNIPAGQGGFDIEIAPIPYKDASRKFVISQGTNLAILQSSAEKALAAWLFIRFASGGEVVPASSDGSKKEVNANVNFAITSGYLPVTKTGEESNAYNQYLTTDQSKMFPADKAKIFAQSVAKEVYVKQNWDRFVDSAFVGSRDIRTEIAKIIPFIIVGASGKKYTPEEAIDYIYNRLPAYVEE